MLHQLINELQEALGILHKQDIQVASTALGQGIDAVQSDEMIRLGDDCAAIPDGDGFLLLAAEGMWPRLVEKEPWFAGWCSVLVNVSDIYAMGGRPIAVVDALWSEFPKQSKLIWEGMLAASKVFNVPIVGGHTNGHSPYSALSVAILGRAKHLITSFNAHPGDVLLLVTDFRGKAHPTYPFWDAATEAPPQRLRDDLSLLPYLAEVELCNTGKDISMGGIVGTALMLIEASGVSATLQIDLIPCPPEVSLQKWLLSFPSYGFLLSVRQENVSMIQTLFQQRDLISAPIGQIEPGSKLQLTWNDESQIFWDIGDRPLTGF